MKALEGHEQAIFMMWIADDRFAHHIMKSIGDRLATFMMWMVCETLADLLPSGFVIENVNVN
jgi:hypothetical protein